VMSAAAAPSANQHESIDPKAAIKRLTLRLARGSFAERSKLYNDSVEARGDNIGTRTFYETQLKKLDSCTNEVDRLVLAASLALEKAGDAEVRRQIAVGALAASADAQKDDKRSKAQQHQAWLTKQQQIANLETKFAEAYPKTSKKRKLKQFEFVDVDEALSDVKQNTIDAKHADDEATATASSSSAPVQRTAAVTSPQSSPTAHAEQPSVPADAASSAGAAQPATQNTPRYPTNRDRRHQNIALRRYEAVAMDCSSAPAPVDASLFGPAPFTFVTPDA